MTPLEQIRTSLPNRGVRLRQMNAIAWFATGVCFAASPAAPIDMAFPAPGRLTNHQNHIDLAADRDPIAPPPDEVIDPSFYDALRRKGADPTRGRLADPAAPATTPQVMKRLIAIDRSTLEHLITLFTGMADTPVDADALRRGAAAVLSAITGELFNPGESVSGIISKRRDVAFRTILLDTDLENTSTLTAAQRTILEKRIRNAGPRLKQFLLANEQEFKTTKFVWMDTDLLP